MSNTRRTTIVSPAAPATNVHDPVYRAKVNKWIEEMRDRDRAEDTQQKLRNTEIGNLPSGGRMTP